MQSWLFVNISSIFILFLLFIWIQIDLTQQEIKNIFKLSIFLTAIVILAEIVCSFTDNTIPKNRWLSIIFNVVGFSLPPYIFILESKMYITDKNVHHILAYILPIINSVLAFMSPLTGWIFYITKGNTYHRGPLFIFFLITFTYSFIYSLSKKIYKVKSYPDYFKKMIITSHIFIVFGMIIQVVFPKLHTTWLVVTIYFVFYYAFSFELNSLVDGLTGMLNRTAYEKHIYCLKQKPDLIIAVIMMDVNNFKTINDTKGHVYGDFCIRETAKIIKQTFPLNTQIFRYGGDEFSIILYVKSEKEIQQYLNQINSLIEKNKIDNPFFPSLSSGYAIYESHSDIHSTINQADKNMYRHKNNSKFNYI